MELLQALYRDDRISITHLNLATRLNRTITDQLCSQLERCSTNGKKVLLTAETKRFSLDKKNLLVADEDCSNAIQIADDFGQTFAAGGGTDGLKIPGWRNDNSIFYLVSRTTYGKAERSAWLKTIAGTAPPTDADVLLRRNLQASRRPGQKSARPLRPPTPPRRQHRQRQPRSQGNGGSTNRRPTRRIRARARKTT
jgi:hypothetical protein